MKPGTRSRLDSSVPINARCAVYHTPEIQARVGDVVDRFVNTEAETSEFSIRVITIGHPDWRMKAKQMLHPVAVQTQGIQAWLVEKEDIALLLAELQSAPTSANTVRRRCS